MSKEALVKVSEVVLEDASEEASLEVSDEVSEEALEEALEEVLMGQFKATMMRYRFSNIENLLRGLKQYNVVTNIRAT